MNFGKIDPLTWILPDPPEPRQGATTTKPALDLFGWEIRRQRWPGRFSLYVKRLSAGPAASGSLPYVAKALQRFIDDGILK